MPQEGKAYLGWEKIKDFLRNEEHGRVNPDNEKRETPLGKLKYEEFIHLRKFYPKNTPWVRAVFCLLAAIISLWDFMLLCTVLYFHMMIEKVVASGLAVLSWFALYKFFYRQDFSPGLPGSGPFKYSVLFKLHKVLLTLTGALESNNGSLSYLSLESLASVVSLVSLESQL